jgi:hypothetical protein
MAAMKRVDSMDPSDSYSDSLAARVWPEECCAGTTCAADRRRLDSLSALGPRTTLERMPGEPATRAMHDLGGVEPLASATIDRHEPALTQFDKNVDALMYLLSHPSRRIIRVDELRRAIESLAPDDYVRLGYYERWLQAMHDLLIEKAVLSADEIARKLAELRGLGRDGTE